MTRPHFAHPHKPEDLFRMFRSKLSIDENAALGSLHDDNQRAIEDAINGLPTPDGGILIAVANVATQGLPTIIYTTDGVTWRAANEPARFESGGGAGNTPSACWTGDRFLAYISSATGPHACLLQSADGFQWDWHPDNTNFPTGGFIGGLAANGTGIVIATMVGGNNLISHDFGATWASSISATAYVAATGNILVGANSPIAATTSHFSLDAGATWADVVFDPAMLAATRKTLYGVVYAAGYWYWLLDDATAGILWRTQDFTTWTRIVTAGDADYPHTVTLNGGVPTVSAAGVHSIFSNGDNIIVILCSGAPFSSNTWGVITIDGGTTWKLLTTTDDAALFVGTVMEHDFIGALFGTQTNFFPQYGVGFGFDRIWVTNPEGPVNGNDTPPMATGFAVDLSDWYGPFLPWALVGDLGYNIGVGGGYGPIVAGFPIAT